MPTDWLCCSGSLWGRGGRGEGHLVILVGSGKGEGHLVILFLVFGRVLLYWQGIGESSCIGRASVSPEHRLVRSRLGGREARNPCNS